MCVCAKKGKGQQKGEQLPQKVCKGVGQLGERQRCHAAGSVVEMQNIYASS